VSPLETCPTCGQPRPTRYCGYCGERALAPDELSLKRFLRSLAEELVPGFEPDESVSGLKRAGGRVYRTVYTLFRYPGRLTADYIAGRRRPYVKPIQVYLSIAVIFFLLGTNYLRFRLSEYDYVPGIGDTRELINAEIARRNWTLDGYTERFNERLIAQKNTMFVVLIPIFALAMLPLFPKRRYGEHLIFSVHVFAAMLLYLAVIVKAFFFVVFSGLRGLAEVNRELAVTIGSFLDFEFVFVSIIYVPFLLYMRSALLTVFGRKNIWGLLSAVVLAVWHVFLIAFVFRMGLFYTTFYSLKWFN
jgi:hypothetical protein